MKGHLLSWASFARHGLVFNCTHPVVREYLPNTDRGEANHKIFDPLPGVSVGKCSVGDRSSEESIQIIVTMVIVSQNYMYYCIKQYFSSPTPLKKYCPK